MSRGSIYMSNRTQNVRLPADVRFPEAVKSVTVRVVGNDRILSPVENTWDSFFLGSAPVTDDFLTERADAYQAEREAF